MNIIITINGSFLFKNLFVLIDYLWEFIDSIEQEIFWVGLGIAALGSYIGYKGYQKKKTKLTRTPLHDQNNGTQDKPIQRLNLGRGGTTLVSNDGHFKGPMTGFPISLAIKGGQLLVSTTIRDIKGNPIAIIENNTWDMQNNAFEYNYDDTALEVVTRDEQQVYFRIELKGSEATVLGNLINKSGIGVNIIEKDVPETGVILQYVHPESPESDYAVKNPPLFKYPRESFAGERREPLN